MIWEVVIGIPLYFMCMWISRIIFSLLLVKLLGKTFEDMKEKGMNTLNDLKGGGNNAQDESRASGSGSE